MPSRQDVYCKFGECAELAQRLETHLGTVLLANGIAESDLSQALHREEAMASVERVNRQTLGQLINQLPSEVVPDSLKASLTAALRTRNELNHSFFRKHNLRMNSETGRERMLQDLQFMHDRILGAYIIVMHLSGLEPSSSLSLQPPDTHLPI